MSGERVERRAESVQRGGGNSSTSGPRFPQRSMQGDGSHQEKDQDTGDGSGKTADLHGKEQQQQEEGAWENRQKTVIAAIQNGHPDQFGADLGEPTTLPRAPDNQRPSPIIPIVEGNNSPITIVVQNQATTVTSPTKFKEQQKPSTLNQNSSPQPSNYNLNTQPDMNQTIKHEPAKQPGKGRLNNWRRTARKIMNTTSDEIISNQLKTHSPRAKRLHEEDAMELNFTERKKACNCT